MYHCSYSNSTFNWNQESNSKLGSSKTRILISILVLKLNPCSSLVFINQTTNQSFLPTKANTHQTLVYKWCRRMQTQLMKWKLMECFQNRCKMKLNKWNWSKWMQRILISKCGFNIWTLMEKCYGNGGANEMK